MQYVELLVKIINMYIMDGLERLMIKLWEMVILEKMIYYLVNYFHLIGILMIDIINSV